MANDRLVAILERLAAYGAEPSGTLHLCELSSELTGTSGASIMLLSDDLARGSLCTTDGIAAYLDDLQFTLGEGPAFETHLEGRVVAAADLAAPERPRWFALTPSAVRAGVRAMFGFPVRIGAVRMGALNLYRDTPGTLSDPQFRDGLLLADVAARTILSVQAGAPPGLVAAELESGANFHLVVHQAAGMVSVQLGVGVTEALVRLRSLAFRSGRAIDDVAGDVVARRLRLSEPEDP
ncbi:MAG TPA: GAF and ANTAR domain-containing protein [Acidimicrobiales bacterium]